MFMGCGALKISCCSRTSPFSPKLPPLMKANVQLSSPDMRSTSCIDDKPMLLLPHSPSQIKLPQLYMASHKGNVVSSLKSPTSSFVHVQVFVSHLSRAS